MKAGQARRGDRQVQRGDRQGADLRRLLLQHRRGHTRSKQQYAEAEAAFKKAIELKPDSGDAYTGLANIYNAQKKFDLAAEASAKAAQYSAAARRRRAAPRPRYNQGVILFNAGKFAEAKAQFEAATKADPNMAMAQYQLGMTSAQPRPDSPTR